MQLTKQETATVLAALRYWQQDLSKEGRYAIIDSEHFAEVSPLTPKAIDALCIRINFDDSDVTQPFRRAAKRDAKTQVIIQVRGGVAEVVQCPKGIDVTIRDYDNEGR